MDLREDLRSADLGLKNNGLFEFLAQLRSDEIRDYFAGYKAGKTAPDIAKAERCTHVALADDSGPGFVV